MARWNSSFMLGASASAASRSLRDRVKRMHGVIVRDGHIGRLVGNQIGLAKEFAVRQQGDAQVAAVHSLAEDFDLPLCDDKEFVAVFAFDDQLIAQRNLFCFEDLDQSRNDGVRNRKKSGTLPERLRRE